MLLSITNTFWVNVLLTLHLATVYNPPPQVCVIDINQGGVYSIWGVDYELKNSVENRATDLLNITFEKR